MSEDRGPEIKKTGPPPQSGRHSQGQGNGGPASGQNGPSINKLLMIFLMGMAITMLLNSCIASFFSYKEVEKISYSEFMQRAAEGKVESVVIDETDRVIYIYPSDQDADKDKVEVYYTGIVTSDTELTSRMEDYGVDMDAEIPKKDSPIVNFILNWVILPLLVFWLLSMVMRKAAKGMGGMGPMGGLGGMGKSRAKEYVPEGSKITFKDVAGQDEAKDSLMEIVDYLNNPGKYRDIGAKLPKGALLVGPPGTGKTLLAKAVAGEAGVPFFSLAGSDFVEMFVGMGASRVRDLFKQAEAKAPCIVFIDEIDAIGKSRDNQLGSNDEREQTLNQLLTEMDGFDGKKGVVILAATNRPESLDPALLRPGRFDRRVPVELPDLKGREAILKVHGQKVKMSDDVDYNAIARATAGASGAELANIVNEATLRAVRFGRKAVCQEDLQESVETVIAGYQKKNAVIPPDERRIVAYHEVGHALVAACQTHSAPVQKITIIPRTSGALGYTMQVDQGERYLMSRDEALNKIATFTGGRAAEEVIFHSITTGASNDIEQATKIARAMVTRYGMTDEFDMVAMETVNNQYLGGDTSLMCSPETAKRIDEKVVQIVREQHEKAIHILKENETKLHEIAAYLLDKETITGEEFMEIFEKQSADGENTLKEEE